MFKRSTKFFVSAISLLIVACSSDTTSDVVDIKGLKVGMPLGEAIKVLETIAPRQGSSASKGDTVRMNAEERLRNDFAAGKIDAEEYNRRQKK